MILLLLLGLYSPVDNNFASCPSKASRDILDAYNASAQTDTSQSRQSELLGRVSDIIHQNPEKCGAFRALRAEMLVRAGLKRKALVDLVHASLRRYSFSLRCSSGRYGLLLLEGVLDGTEEIFGGGYRLPSVAEVIAASHEAWDEMDAMAGEVFVSVLASNICDSNIYRGEYARHLLLLAARRRDFCEARRLVSLHSVEVTRSELRKLENPCREEVRSTEITIRR